MRILIAGCGYVGTALAEVLVKDGHSVWGLRRGGVVLPKGAESVQADVDKPETLTMLPSGIDAVVYAVSAGAYDEARYRAAYVDGPRNMLKALTATSPAIRRFVFVSSTGVYAQDGGDWVDEESPAEQTHFSGATLLEGERAVLAGPIPCTIVRLGGIYGPGRARLVDSVRDGTATIPAAPSYINLIHRDDCAGILRHVLTMNKPARLYLGVDSEPVDRRELLAWIAQQLGVPTPPQDTAAPSARSLRGNKRCKNKRVLSSGYRFLYATYREGFGEIGI